MSEIDPKPVRTRKTPEEATDFEREQLRFFLSQGELSTTLATLNPSIAWLPILSQMKLVQNERQLASWIERNFSDVQAVRDVVANLRFFGPDTANLLDRRLTAQVDRLGPLLIQSWRLIIRHMRSATHGGLNNDWFDIEPRIKRGETSADVLHRLAEMLRPRLRLGRRLPFADEVEEVLKSPTQLMSIDFEVDGYPTADDVLAAWPTGLDEREDSKLLAELTNGLAAALEEATDAGVEGSDGFGTTDFDVPSIAKHEQNEHRDGFQAIVRVMAETWELLARKSAERASFFFDEWVSYPYRLMRRLILFACANSIVPAERAADELLTLPQGELFLTSSSVEVFRLIRTRWNEFPAEKQLDILRRLREGPPRDWFKSDSETDKHIDRARFDILAEMERGGFHLGNETGAYLEQIRARWPDWELRPSVQAGFHFWHEAGWVGDGNAADFENVPDHDLVNEAKRSAKSSELGRGDSWRALCLADPDRALRGLEASVANEDWPADLWERLLWANKATSDSRCEQRIAELLLSWPLQNFGKIAPAASWWLNEHARTLGDAILWRLWDRIADVSLLPAEGATNE